MAPPRVLVLAGVAVTTCLAGGLDAEAVSSTPNDPYFASQWGLWGATASIGAPAAWCAGTGTGVTIADVDTGADFGHPDLAGKLVPGAAFLSGTGSPSGSGAAAVQDDNGHGTMTTGIAAADADNATGIAGVAPGARVLVVKVLAGNGSGSDSDVAAGIRWAADHGAQVINVSIGVDVGGTGVGVATGLTSSIPGAVQYAAQRGAAVALAAGNGSMPASGYVTLANTPGVLVVGALQRDGSRASYSNFSYQVSVYAPGGAGTSSSDQATRLQQDVVSTYLGGGYATGAGTSFAAPHVAGVLALLMARGMSASAAAQRITASADIRSGMPELDAASALGVAGACGPPPAGAAGGQTNHAVSGAAGGSGAGAVPTGAAAAVAGAHAAGAVTPGPALGGDGAPLAAVARSAPPGAARTPAAPGSGSAGMPGWAGALAAVAVVGTGGTAWLLRRRRAAARRRP